MDSGTRAPSPTEVFREWQRCLAANDQQGAAKMVDVDGYTEICLGLTDWTTGYEVAAANFYRNMIAPWSEMTFSVEDLTESADGVTVRSRVSATHTGEFLASRQPDASSNGTTSRSSKSKTAALLASGPSQTSGASTSS